MLSHKSVNVGLAALTVVLSLTTFLWADKDVEDVKKAGLNKVGAGKDLVNFHKSSIALFVFSLILLLMTIGAFHLNDKKFAVAKAVVCVGVLILSFLMVGFGGSLNKLSLEKRYDATGITSGVFGILLTGSCAFTVLKMLHLLK